MVIYWFNKLYWQVKARQISAGPYKNMIAIEALITYCLNKDHAYADYPFGPDPVCIKVKGKIFAEIYMSTESCKITPKCDPVILASNPIAIPYG